MKTKFIVFFLMWFTQTFATDYFVRVDGGTGAGTSDATAWNIATILTNYNTLIAGDRLLFKSGQTFNLPSSLIVTGNAGTVSNPITYGSYGSGALPIITGIKTITGWTAHPTIAGVFYASLDVPELQVVTVDGVMREMGRYPKTGYLPIQSHTSDQLTFTSTSIGTLPFNPLGGRAVSKKARYIIDRQPITAVSGNTVTVTRPNDEYGNTNSIYEFSDGNGFFIQAHPGTLTQLGDWYYDKIAKRLYVHFGGGNSSSHVIGASVVQNLVQANSRSFIKFENIDFREANLALINIQYANNITIQNCNLTRATVGIQALQGSGTALIANNVIEDIYSTAISTYESNGFTIYNNLIHRVHQFAGMGKSGELAGSGMALTGNNLVIMFNRVVNVGYCGISFYGSGVADIGKAGNNVRVENNFVDSFCTQKDDGGGIYAFGNADQTFVPRLIKNNIVTNGIGNVEGAAAFALQPTAMGIYMDNFSSNTRIENNYVANNTGSGLFFNSVKYDTAVNNVFFNNKYSGFLMLYLVGQDVLGHVVTNNDFISTGSEPGMNYEMYRPLNLLNGIGNFSGNRFSRPFSTSSVLRIDNRQNQGKVITDLTIPQFQSTYNLEQGSVLSTVPVSSPSAFVGTYNFSAASVNLSTTTVKKDLLGNSYDNGTTIAPYSGRVFIETGVSLVQPVNVPLKIYRKVKTL